MYVIDVTAPVVSLRTPHAHHHFRQSVPVLRQDVWLTLTDYNRLAEYVPNLTQSKTKPAEDGTIKLWQEGAQKIVGFDFRASVEMFMEEHFGERVYCPCYRLFFSPHIFAFIFDTKCRGSAEHHSICFVARPLPLPSRGRHACLRPARPAVQAFEEAIVRATKRSDWTK